MPSTKAKKVEEKMEVPKITQGALVKTWGALAQLAAQGRYLPTLDADLKIGRLLRIYEPEGKLLETARNRVSMDILKDRKLDNLMPLEHERLAGEIAAAQAVFDGKEMEWEPPKWKVTEADLPRGKDDGKGRENAVGVGGIINGLGDLFEFKD